jgi:hypothetical protein
VLGKQEQRVCQGGVIDLSDGEIDVSD